MLSTLGRGFGLMDQEVSPEATDTITSTKVSCMLDVLQCPSGED